MAEKVWRDSGELRRLYWDEKMSQKEIAEELGCSSSTIDKWMKKHGIESRDRKVASSIARGPLNPQTNERGYEVVNARVGGEPTTVLLHRLTAVAEHGFDAVADNVVHHKSGVEWDNRPSNLEVLEDAVHKSKHAARRDRTETGEFA